MGTSVSFQFRNEQFFARSRKTRGCAEAYRGTSHKQLRSLTPRLWKRAIYEWKLSNFASKNTGPSAPTDGSMTIFFFELFILYNFMGSKTVPKLMRVEVVFNSRGRQISAKWKISDVNITLTAMFTCRVFPVHSREHPGGVSR